jgi:hypothetical protein
MRNSDAVLAGAAAPLNLPLSEDVTMQPQLVTAEDEENYGSALIDMTKRAAVEALAPELQQLRAQNEHLRSMAARAQHVEIERALDRSVPSWREIYQDPGFSQWLSQPDDFSGATRSQLLRNAVANGDSGRVVAFYKGFQPAAGQYGSARSYQSRRTATAGNIYTRQQIQNLYERRRKGEFNDATWARWEQEILAAANQGRIAGALDRDGNKLTELR